MNRPRFFRCWILLAALATVPSEQARAGAWLREPGEVYAKLGLSRQTADRLFGAKSNKRLPTAELTDDAVDFYAEYGLHPRWTSVASLSLRRMEREANGPSVENAGPADLWLFAKRGLLTAPFVLSTQFGVKLPLGYSKRATVPLGDGQIDYEGRVLVGKSVGRAYGGAEIGYRKRNGDLSDQLPFRIETGVSLTSQVLLTLSLDGIENRTNDAAGTTPLDRRAANIFDKEYMNFSPGVKSNGSSLNRPMTSSCVVVRFCI